MFMFLFVCCLFLGPAYVGTCGTLFAIQSHGCVTKDARRGTAGEGAIEARKSESVYKTVRHAK